MIKIVYKYINEFIKEDELILNLETFRDSLESAKDKKSLSDLISDIKDVVDDIQNDFLTLKYDKICDLLYSNDVYINLVNQMNDNDIMLMITDYISAPKVPNLNQEAFDKLVDAAINSGEDSRENCWRLAFNYEYHNLNFDKIIDYYISIRDVWYLVELMHFLQDDYDLDGIIEKVIETKDKDFIKGLLNDNFIDSTLGTLQIEKLKEQL